MYHGGGEDRRVIVAGRSLLELVFSWSLKDVFNRDLYKGQVQKIPETFSSPFEYLRSFVKPLIEETHADLCTNMASMCRPLVCEVLSVETSKCFKLPKELFYDLVLRPKDKNDKFITYEPEVGDLIALTDVFPRSINDLKRPGRQYVIAYVKTCNNDMDSEYITFTVFSSKPILDLSDDENVRALPLFVVHLMNMTTNIRIYRALNSELEGGNMNVIKHVLQPDSEGENCSACDLKVMHSDEFSDIRSLVKSWDSNDSQETAILSSIGLKVCEDQNSVNLIWGPPGTGKTKTIGQLLFCLLKMKCRTLTCAPTNIAVLTVTERLLNKTLESLEYKTYGIGDIILLGNEKRMKMDERYDLLDVFVDYRAKTLAKCFSPSTGYKQILRDMISLLEDPQERYRFYLEPGNQFETEFEDDELNYNDHGEEKDNEHRLTKFLKKEFVEAMKEHKNKHKGGKGNSKGKSKANGKTRAGLSLKEFVLKRFSYTFSWLEFCVENLYTHLPTLLISLQEVQKMVSTTRLLRSLATLVTAIDDERLEQVFKDFSSEGSRDENLIKFINIRKECLALLESLPQSFADPIFIDKPSDLLDREIVIHNFCLSNACLVFCTASSSVKLHTKGMARVELLVIDEAAQLKECESAIPLQLSGLRHAILIGDEKQLSPMVQSKISGEAEFGRSLFQRLAQLGHKKHLLNVQYRMHPSISLFPNREFYNGQISDASVVQTRSYEKQFLGGNMYGPFSFINIAHGKEQYGGGHSAKNLVEVAVIAEILANLFQEFVRTKRKISIGVILPYSAQVNAIQEKIGESYKPRSDSSFSVSVRSVDGFQGSEEDVIIISTVRSNWNGQIGFLSNHQRTNVALTRAKYCLWVLGSGTTLKNSDTIWRKLVMDAEERGCYFEAEKDDRLSKAISDSLLQLSQLDILLSKDSPLFRKSKWKVCFSAEFWKSIEKMKNVEMRKEVISLLEKLSNGWRQPQRDATFVALEGTSAQLLEQYKINNLLSLIWSVDIQKEGSHYIQVVKVWDVSTFEDIPKLAERLDRVFGCYTVIKMDRCKAKASPSQGNVNEVVPMKWHEDLGEMPQTDINDILSKPFASLSLRNRDGSSSSSSRPRNYQNFNTRGRGGASSTQDNERW